MSPHELPSTGGSGLVEFSTRRRVTVAMMTLTLVLFGLISLSSLKVELLPDLSYPTLTVRIDYEGAAPSEVETLISQPAEEALGVVKGLRKLRSISRTGQSDVVLEFAWGTDMEQAGLDVRDKMEALQLPLEVAVNGPLVYVANHGNHTLAVCDLAGDGTLGACEAGRAGQTMLYPNGAAFQPAAK